MRHVHLALCIVAACSESSSSPDDAGSTPPDLDGASSDATGSDAAATDGDARDSGAPIDANALGPARVYVGSSDGKIRVFAFDTSTYALTLKDTVSAGKNPSFLGFDPTRTSVYAVDEGTSQVEAFSFDAKSGALGALGAVASGGAGPAHVSVDRGGAYVMAANYGGGTIAVFPRGADGRLGAPTATRSFGGTALTHQIVTDPSNAFVLVPNKGLDAVAVFRLLGGGTLADAGLVPAGDGARHIAFDPPGTHAYVIDELGSTVTAFTFDPGSGALAQIQQVSSLAPGTTTANTGAEIQLTADGKHVLASNRGDDSIVVFDVDGAGKLTYAARVSTGGQTPRHFQIDVTGRFLFVGNQTSGSVVAMKMDASTGVPAPIGTPLAVPGPEYVGLVYLDP
jgi:6-phosphogluconolactonase